MYRLLFLLLFFIPIISAGQSVLPLRADTIRVEKLGGSAELHLRNATRDTLGVLTNIGNGRTRFIRARIVGDTLFVGRDTLIIATDPTLQEVINNGNTISENDSINVAAGNTLTIHGGTGSSIILKALQSAVSHSRVVIQPGLLGLEYRNLSSGNIKSLTMSSLNGITVTDQDSQTGLGYAANYRTNGIANFGDRWIPDWGTVKDSIAAAGGGSSTLADSSTNGLMSARKVRDLGAKTVDWYNFNEYGGVGNGIADNTAALNNLITIIKNKHPKRNSVIFFPDSVYIFSSPTSDTTRINAIIAFPEVKIDSQQYSIKLKGNGVPPFSPSGYFGVPQPAGTKLRVTYNVKHGNNPCFLGGKGDIANIYNEVSYMMPMLEDITIQMPDTSRLTAVDFRYFTNTNLKNVNVTSGISQSILDKPEPLDSTVYGVRQPHTLSGIMQLADNVNVMGFYNGFEAGEGAIIDNLNIFSCKNGIVCDSAGGIILIKRYIGGWCKYFVVHRPSMQGTSMVIQSYNCERWDPAWLTPADSNWYNFVADVRDDATTPQSKLKADIAFRNVTAGGPYLPWAFANIGGDSVYAHEQANRVTNYYDVAALVTKTNRFVNRNTYYETGNLEFYQQPPGSETDGAAIGIATPGTSIDGHLHLSGYGGLFSGGSGWGDYLWFHHTTGHATLASSLSAAGTISNTFNSNSFVGGFSSTNSSTGTSAGLQSVLTNSLSNTVSYGITGGNYATAPFGSDRGFLQTSASNGLLLAAPSLAYNASGTNRFTVSGSGDGYFSGKLGIGTTPNLFGLELANNGYNVPSTDLNIIQAVENVANTKGLYLGYNSSTNAGAITPMAGGLEVWTNVSGTFSPKFNISNSGEVNIGSTTDQGAFTLQNTGGFYQNGTVSLNGTFGGSGAWKWLVKNPDSSIAYINKNEVTVDSMTIGGFNISGRGFGGAPSMTTSSFMTFFNNSNLVIYEGVGTASTNYPKLRLTGSGSSAPLIYSGIFEALNRAPASGSQPLLITTTGDAISTNFIAGNIIIRPGTNSVVATAASAQFTNDSVLIDLNGSGRLIIQDNDAKYNGNFAANYTARSLVDKNYADSSIAVSNGTSYTPTITSVTNVASTTLKGARYYRHGSFVEVRVYVSIDPTSAGSTEIAISLPVASELAADDLFGSGNCGVAAQSGIVTTDATNNRATFIFSSTDTGAQDHVLIFSYPIILP